MGHVTPLGDIVIVRRSEPAKVSAGGIHLAWDSDYREDIGEVVYVGQGKRHRCKACLTDTVIPLTVKPGDTVLFSTNGHQLTTVNGEQLIVLREPSIIGIISTKDGIESGTRKLDRQYLGVE